MDYREVVDSLIKEKIEQGASPRNAHKIVDIRLRQALREARSKPPGERKRRKY